MRIMSQNAVRHVIMVEKKVENVQKCHRHDIILLKCHAYGIIVTHYRSFFYHNDMPNGIINGIINGILTLNSHNLFNNRNQLLLLFNKVTHRF